MTSSGSRASSPVLVCFAMPDEAKFFSVPEALKGQVEVLLTGIGRQNAIRTVEGACRRLRPKLVLSCGFAGALRPGLPVGTVVFSESGNPRCAAILQQLGAVAVSFHCSGRIAATSLEKKELWEQTRCAAVEMESEAIQELCRKQRISCATIRVISDAADEDFPIDFNLVMNERQQLDVRKLAWAICTRPAKIPGLLRLQRQTRRAAQILAAVLARFLCERLIG